MTRVRFYRSASAEAEAAIRWYNERITGLGDDLRDALVAGVERVGQAPLTWPISPYDPRARCYRLSRLPYSIVYVVDTRGNVTVAALAHAKRRPGYWRRRIRP